MMRLFRRRKAFLFFTILLGLFLLISLLPLAIETSFRQEAKYSTIGESQLILLRTYEKGEKLLYYIDQSAVHALKQSLYLGAEEGFSSGECGTYDGYNLWNTEEEECYPDLKQEVKQAFLSELEAYLQQYAEFPEIDYELFIAEDGMFVGKASSRVAMEISDDDAIVIWDSQVEEQGGTGVRPRPAPSGDCGPVGNKFSDLPLKPWPNRIIKAFGARAPYQTSGTHTGIDVANPRANGQEPPLYAVDCGRVVYVGPLFLDGPYVGRGSKAIIIDHGDNVYTVYSHNSYVEQDIMNDLKAQGYSDVVAGQVIGRQGNEGYSSGSHLHFEVHTGTEFTGNWRSPWAGGRYEDPLKWLRI